MEFLAVAITLLSISAPLTASIIQWKANGSNVSIREFLEFKTQICDSLDSLQSEVATLRELIQTRLI